MVLDTDVHDPELARCAATFRANRALADRIAGGLTVEWFNWRPAPGKWSVAQCLAHLNVSGGLYAARIEDAIRKGRARGTLGSGPFDYGLLSRLMLRAVDPANRRKARAPGKFAPSEGDSYSPAAVLADFHAAGARWERLLREADGLHLGRVKVRSPVSPLIRFSLGATFAIQAAHEQRHLRQAGDVLRLMARSQERGGESG
jgi:hypothetical protein